MFPSWCFCIYSDGDAGVCFRTQYSRLRCLVPRLTLLRGAALQQRPPRHRLIMYPPPTHLDCAGAVTPFPLPQRRSSSPPTHLLVISSTCVLGAIFSYFFYYALICGSDNQVLLYIPIIINPSPYFRRLSLRLCVLCGNYSATELPDNWYNYFTSQNWFRETER